MVEAQLFSLVEICSGFQIYIKLFKVALYE